MKKKGYLIIVDDPLAYKDVHVDEEKIRKWYETSLLKRGINEKEKVLQKKENGIHGD